MYGKNALKMIIFCALFCNFFLKNVQKWTFLRFFKNFLKSWKFPKILSKNSRKISKIFPKILPKNSPKSCPKILQNLAQKFSEISRKTLQNLAQKFSEISRKISLNFAPKYFLKKFAFFWLFEISRKNSDDFGKKHVKSSEVDFQKLHFSKYFLPPYVHNFFPNPRAHFFVFKIMRNVR